MWEERYATPEYLFGKDPSIFITEKTQYLKAGQSALVVADGEGRNSVFIAQQGLNVSAMDGAPNAVEKAKALAQEHAVTVDFQVADIMTWDWDAVQYDLVVGIFIQFSGPDSRIEVFEGLKRCLKPGGVLLLHGYTPEQIKLGTGGPPFVENMYTEKLLAGSFADFEILELTAYQREVQEGRGHSGMSALIDLVARKRP
ncbi:MAG: class I SAM-dependent methyltransferase [Rhodobacteraceae bacterium]|nr:class I SAM-dependent methyltransferase [Paracoccaceae bacterium]